MTSPLLTAPMTATQRTTDRSRSVTTSASRSGCSMHRDRDATNRLGRFGDHPSPAPARANSDTSCPGWAEPQAMALNWERLARTAMHPVKIAVLEQLAHGE